MQHSQAEIESTSYSTKPLLRPHQITEAKSEMKSLNDQLVNPIVQDKAQVAKQLRKITENYNKQVPETPKAGSVEESRMVARSKWLLEQIVPHMNSQEEMRKCPPGSVDKYRKGEGGRLKPFINEWKNLQLRLHPGEADAANLEKHRPKTSTLNMDNSVVSTKTYIMPETSSGVIVTFSDEQIQLLRLISPETADKLATMPNDLRLRIKDVLDGKQAPTKTTKQASSTKKPNKKKTKKPAVKVAKKEGQTATA